MTLSDVVVPIEILTYSVEEGTVNGHTVTRGHYPTIHDACIALTVPYAQQAGAPILTHAVDTIGQPSEYWLHVHPDGQATPAPAGVSASPVPRPRDRSQADRAQADRPSPDRLQADRPPNDRPSADRPPADRPSASSGAPSEPLRLAPLPVLSRLPGVAPFPAMPPLPSNSNAEEFALDHGLAWDDAPVIDHSAHDAQASARSESGSTGSPASVAKTSAAHDNNKPPADPDDPNGLADTQTFARIPAAEPDAEPEPTAVAAVPAEPEEGRAIEPSPLSNAKSNRRHSAEHPKPSPTGPPAQASPATQAGAPLASTTAPWVAASPVAASLMRPVAVRTQVSAPVPPSAGSDAPLEPAGPHNTGSPVKTSDLVNTASPARAAAVVGGAGSSNPDHTSPTLGDLLATRPAPHDGPAQLGWRVTVRRLTGGLITFRPSQAEAFQRKAIAAVQRSLTGPKTVVVINPKGGASKTTASLLLAATFGIHRGGYTLAWDNNESRGTMGLRATQGRHTRTAVDLLSELDKFEDARSARVGDLDNFVRSQGNAQFDVLASDEDAASAASVDAEAFTALHRSLSRFYRIIVVDTGNNMRASNWDAAVTAADQVVIVSTIREDTGQSAAWVADALNKKGHADKVSQAITILAGPGPRADPALSTRLGDHFGRLTRGVVRVPFDASLVAGGPIDFEALSPASRDAWLEATALVADGL